MHYELQEVRQFAAEASANTRRCNEIISRLEEINSAKQNQIALLNQSLNDLRSITEDLNTEVGHFQQLHKQSLYESAELVRKQEFLQNLIKSEASDCFKLHVGKNFTRSKSQLLQDLVAHFLFGSNGFFCEIGAADGVSLSNTFLLEKDHTWTGILVEPARIWHESLSQNRTSVINHSCIYSESGVSIEFLETQDPFFSRTSQVKELQPTFHEASFSAVKSTYSVLSLSLNDLLKQYNAPTFIEYLSLDVEGSELAILQSFDFSQYSFGLITVEHNYLSDREVIFELLKLNGYQRFLENVSGWEDWYVHNKYSTLI